MAKSKKKGRAQHRAQKAKAQARERAMPPAAVSVECRDESGRPIPASCEPPAPRYVSEGGRQRVRYYSPSPREKAQAQGDAFIVTLIDGCSGEIITRGGRELDAVIMPRVRPARHHGLVWV